MWTITNDRPISPIRFLLDRARRIIPLYWIATCVMAIGGVVGLFPKMRVTPWHIVSSLLFIPHYSPDNGQLWPLLVPGWTLNYEVFFYLSFAAPLLLRRNSQLIILTASFTFLVLLGSISHTSNAAFLTYTAAIQLEFVAGLWLGWLWTKQFIPPSFIGGLLVAAAVAAFAALPTFAPNIPRVLAFGVPALFLVSGSLFLEASGTIFHSRLLLRIGDTSYSSYLWHGLAVSVALKICGGFHLPSWCSFFITIIGGISVGLLSYAFLEKPLLGWLSRRRPLDPVGGVVAPLCPQFKA